MKSSAKKGNSKLMVGVLGAMIMLAIIAIAVVILLFTNPYLKDSVTSFINDTNAGYMLADYDKYAVENGDDMKQDQIFIFASKAEVDDKDGHEFLRCYTSDGEWIVPLQLFDSTDIANIKKSIKIKPIKIYGTYMGYSDNYDLPGIMPAKAVIEATGYTASAVNALSMLGDESK